jgi:hypothetical protein
LSSLLLFISDSKKGRRAKPTPSRNLSGGLTGTSRKSLADWNEEREIQRKVDRSDKVKASRQKKEKPGAMQAGARVYPEPPLPSQHLQKPGSEADLDLQPMYDAPTLQRF